MGTVSISPFQHLRVLQSTVQPELHLDDTAGSTCDIERGHLVIEKWMRPRENNMVYILYILYV